MVTVIDKALTRLTLDACFYAGILLNMKIIESDKFPIAATDGKNLWLNPEGNGAGGSRELRRDARS